MHTAFVAGCGKLHLPLPSLHKIPTEIAGIYAHVISLVGEGGEIWCTYISVKSLS